MLEFKEGDYVKVVYDSNGTTKTVKGIILKENDLLRYIHGVESPIEIGKRFIIQCNFLPLDNDYNNILSLIRNRTVKNGNWN